MVRVTLGWPDSAHTMVPLRCPWPCSGPQFPSPYNEFGFVLILEIGPAMKALHRWWGGGRGHKEDPGRSVGGQNRLSPTRGMLQAPHHQCLGTSLSSPWGSLMDSPVVAL